MDALALRLTQGLQDERMVVGIVALEHADHVGSVDQAVAGHLRTKILTISIGDGVPEVGEDLLMLVLHVDVVEFGDNDSVVVAVLKSK